MASAMPTRGCRSPVGVRRTTPAPSISWPSRKMVALTSKVSPATALAGRRPHSRTGCTSRMGMRPITSERYPLTGRRIRRHREDAGVRRQNCFAAGLLARLAADPGYLARLGEMAADLDEYLTGPRWYQLSADELAGAPAAVAYFSPEYGIAGALPQYSGGLGILAGDHLKAASDLGVPLIGVGLLYRHGYFSQSLSAEGWQLERYPGADPSGLPLTLLREAGGSPVRVGVTLAEGGVLAAQVWLAQVGRVPLLLLDSYVEENEPALREVPDL